MSKTSRKASKRRKSLRGDRILFRRLKNMFLDPLAHPMGPQLSSQLTLLELRYCDEIDRERARGRQKLERARYFAHVGCKPGVVCVATAFPGLPLQAKLGVLSHEIGHVLSVGGDDRSADIVMYRRFGLEIEYKNELELQYIDPESDFMKRFTAILPAPGN